MLVREPDQLGVGPRQQHAASGGTTAGVLAVIVSSGVSKSGSVISGNTVHVVVVKTNPGYAPDPGHAGTGKVVATVC